MFSACRNSCPPVDTPPSFSLPCLTPRSRVTAGASTAPGSGVFRPWGRGIVIQAPSVFSPLGFELSLLGGRASGGSKGGTERGLSQDGDSRPSNVDGSSRWVQSLLYGLVVLRPGRVRVRSPELRSIRWRTNN